MANLITNPALSQFIVATQTLDNGQDMTPHLQAMQAWQANLWQSFKTHPFDKTGLNPQGDIAHTIDGLETWVGQIQQNSDIAYQSLSDTRDLIAQFEQKVILLLFGKFNAGKSSLCNVLATCFRQSNQAVEYFYVENGRIVFTPETFQEGATETTARLQGVCLDERLVLLDTPGLHSVTADNASLTQRFLESADGVLWLTSSSSPGQVHELDNLAQELLRQKPLLPVITRSDYLEEDELNGDIVQVLCNKDTAQRQLQEQDVTARAIEKLEQMQANTALLKAPVSISAHYLTQAHFSDEAMTDSGFERLLMALRQLIEPALAYKQRKPAEIYLHYLQENLVTPFTQDFANQLADFEKKIHSEINSLDNKKNQITQQVWRDVVPTLPTLLDKYRPLSDTASLLVEITQLINETLPTQISHQLLNSNNTLEPLRELVLQSAVLYQSDDSDSTQPNIDEANLYKNVCDSLTHTLQNSVDKVIKDYGEHLSRRIQDINILQQKLTIAQLALDELSVQLRE